MTMRTTNDAVRLTSPRASVLAREPQCGGEGAEARGPDDAALLQAWRAGDRQSGQSLFRRHFRAVRRFFLNKTAEGVDDLVQETFERCVGGHERLQDPSRFRSYVFGIAHHVLKEHYRDRHGRMVDFQTSSVAMLSGTPSLQLAQRAEHLRLLEALRSIPLELQLALELYYWEGMSSVDIAEVLDIPESTARGRLSRGRALLRERLSQAARIYRARNPDVTSLESWARELGRRIERPAPGPQ